MDMSLGIHASSAAAVLSTVAAGHAIEIATTETSAPKTCATLSLENANTPN
jgi:hypothetical protein